MKIYFDELLPSPCVGCGSLFRFENLLCSKCENKIFAMLIPKSRITAPFPGGQVTSLFEWRPGISDLLSRYILSLKGSNRQPAWNFWSEIFRQTEITASTSAVLIPVPSRSRRPDHAYFFAEALSKLLAIPLLTDAVIRKDTLPLHIERNSGNSPKFKRIIDLPETCQPIIVDDVLTRGETAHTLLRVLEKPTPAQVYTFARRART